MPFKTIDLCAGIGGIRRGFEMTGYFENVLASEIDQFACMTYEHLYHEDAHHDLTTEEFKSLVEQTDYDILLAGFPCQSFSKAGLELGFADKTKGTIFYHIAEIIQRTRPRAIFLENVDNQTICTDVMDTLNRMNFNRIKGVLLAIRDFKELLDDNEGITEYFRECKKYLNHYAAVTTLDFLEVEEIQKLAFDYMVKLRDQKQKKKRK